MIVPLEAPLLDPEVAPLDVAPEPVPDPLDAPLPEPAPLPDPDADPPLPLVPARLPLLPPLAPLLLADPGEPPSSDAAPCPDALDPLPHPAPTAQAKAANESDTTKVDRRMKILLNPWEARSTRNGLKFLFEGRSQLPFYHAMFAPGALVVCSTGRYLRDRDVAQSRLLQMLMGLAPRPRSRSPNLLPLEGAFVHSSCPNYTYVCVLVGRTFRHCTCFVSPGRDSGWW